MRTYFFSRFLAALVGLLFTTAPLFSQVSDPPAGVAVKIWAKGKVYVDSGDTGSVTLSGSFLPSTVNGTDGDATVTASSDVNEADVVAVLGGAQGYVRVEPAKSYSVSVTGSNYYGGALSVTAPPGYRVLMDNMWRTKEGFGESATIVFQLLPLGAKHPGLGGMATSISSLEIDWRVSLGSLPNGASAGDLSLIDTGTRADWSAIFTPSSLYYESTSDEVSVTRANNIISRIVAPQVVMDIVTLTTSYEIRCYSSSQWVNVAPPGQYGYMGLIGSPYVTYRVQQGATSTTLKITKEVRNVTDATSTFAVARREIMSLARTGTWPSFTWTKSDWTLESQTPLTETVVSSSGTASARTETIAVRVPGSSTPVLSLSRSFTVPTVSGNSVIGEVLSAETVGTSNAMSASFNYHTDTSNFGSLGYLKSATLPGGGWIAYDYYDGDPSANQPTGRVRYRYRPYLNSPTTVSQSTATGEVTYYEYVNDVFDAPTRVSLMQTK